MQFKNQVVVITGGGRGIGEATARAFAAQGARVIVTARTASEINAVAASIKKSDGQAWAIPCDVADEPQVKNLFFKVEKEAGPVDILINNAAHFFVKTLEELTVEDWDTMMAVNLRSLFLCSREAVRMMKQKKSGVIVNVSSVAGVPTIEKFPGSSAYCASKGGVTLFTEALASELRPFSIRVNCISPGGVNTRMFREGLPQLQWDMEPEEVAQAILFLASPAARPVIGTNLIYPG